MTVPGNIDALLLGGQRGYQIERSLRFNSADSAYLNRTYSGACLDAKLMTISVWVKRSKLTTAGQQPIFSSYSAVRFGGDLTWTAADKIQFRPGGNGDGASNQYSISTDAVFRDPSAWYHIVVQYDSTQATSTNRQKIYVNGVQQTVTGNYPTQNYLHTYAFNNANNQIGAYTSYGTDYLDSYLTEFHFIDGQALTPSSFGETDTITGVWKPKKYTGTYGTNGFYLKFADNSGTTSTTLGKDSSGNGNNWTPNNFSVTAGAGNDSMIDTPTPYADGGNGRGNYCTWLPQQGGQTWTFSNGNLDAINGNTGVAGFSCIGTIAVSTGKWYWEVTCNDAGGTTLRVPGVGIMGSERDVLSTAATVRPDVYLSGNGTIDNSAGTALQSGFSNMAAGDVVGVALDAGAKTVQFYRNGSAVGTAQSYTAAFVTPSFYSYNTYDCNANFGQRPFVYTPPTGFKALNTQNLPEPSIKKPSSYMDVLAYSGDGATSRAITGLGFSPDLVWIKARNASYNHVLFDAVRGTGGTKVLFSNRTTAEGGGTGEEGTNYGHVSSFDSAGFTVATGALNRIWVNDNLNTYVAWCWDESATPGFDIVTYTGNGTNRTIAHSLGVAPKMIFVKPRSSSGDWIVYHESSANTRYLVLNLTNAQTTSSTVWNNTSPTGSDFALGTNTAVNNNTTTYVAYLWSEVAGFSKFGSYTGNGSSDGPFVFCGFRPRWVMVKRTDTGGYDWEMYDSARADSNVIGNRLWANLSTAENSATRIDFLSNGFKIRDSGGQVNGGTIVFAAFAESPAKYSLAR